MATIVSLKRVSAYRTADATLHAERGAAVRHQARLDLEAWLRAAAPEAGDDVVAALIEGAETVIALLRKAATKPADPEASHAGG